MIRRIWERLFPGRGWGSGELDLPLPSRAFDRYMWFWHVVAIVLFVGALTAALWTRRDALGWPEVVLSALVAFQLGAYARIYILAERWPPPWWQHVIYFGGGLIAWFIEVRIASGFSILLWVFYGQAFGLLPPAGVVSVVTLIQFIFLGSAVDWDFARVQPELVLGVGLSWVSTLVAYWFIYNAVQTSHERGRLVMELEAARRDLEAARQSDAELAALRERERLARDMHDSLGHALAALSVQLEAAQRMIRRDPERVAAQMDDMKALTRQSMDTLRRTLAGLRAPGLGERTLRHAIQETCIAASQRSGMTVNCTIAPEADGLSPAVAEALWGVTQEALTNVEKHAGARRAEVVLDVLPREVRLRVQDDGAGLPADAFTRAGHYGLRGMRERVEGIGGALHIAPGAPSGTLVEASVPLI